MPASSPRGGVPLPSTARSRLEATLAAPLGAVRLHQGTEATRAAAALGARAFALGNDIVLGASAPPLASAPGLALLAHEAAHTVQGGPVVRRALTAEQLPRTPVETIMADETWFERGIERIEFFTAELARLHYPGGGYIDVGLVPEQMVPPIEATDYRTDRSEQAPYNPTGTGLGTGSIRFIPRIRQLRPAPGMDLPALARVAGRTIRFTHHAGTGRIVPTEVNSISAPHLCAVLREAEAEYDRQTTAMAEGMAEVFRRLGTIVMLRGLLPSGAPGAAAGTRGSAARGGAAVAASGPFGRAVTTLSQSFQRLLRAPAGAAGAEIAVEGVAFGGVEVALTGGRLIVSRSVIVNVGRQAGQGRLMATAFEQAAAQAARAAGATHAEVHIATVVNPAWRAWLEANGYAAQIVETATGFGLRHVKVIAL